MVWTTRDGTRMKLSEMTESHLENALAFVERSLKRQLQQEINALWALSSMLHGEMALDHVESVLNDLESKSIDNLLWESPEYRALWEELLNRQMERARDGTCKVVINVSKRHIESPLSR